MSFTLYQVGGASVNIDSQVAWRIPDANILITQLNKQGIAKRIEVFKAIRELFEKLLKEDRDMNEEEKKQFMLYFAGARSAEEDNFLAEKTCNRLFSQLNDRGSIKSWLEKAPKGKLFIDSGAHTAHTQGKEIDVDEYINYVNELDEDIECFAQVDKIPGVYRKPKTRQDWLEAPAKSWENYLYMRNKLKSPDKLIPVFHQGEDFKWLENMLEWTDKDGRHIPYIGISPRGDVSVKEKEIYISKCFDIIKKSSNPNVKTHAFGMTSLELLERYPFYSADSTTWLLTAAMGNIMTPWGNVYCSDRKSSPGHIDEYPEEAKKKIVDFIEKIGYTLEDVQTDYTARMIVNCTYLKYWADNYQYKPATVKRGSLI